MTCSPVPFMPPSKIRRVVIGRQEFARLVGPARRP